MTLSHTADTPARAAPWPTRRISRNDLTWALSEGWKDFNAKRGDLLVLALLYPLLGCLAAALAFNDTLIPMVFPLIAGVSILGPAVASGLYEIARRREAGQESSWLHFFDPLRGRSRWPLAVLTAGLVMLFIAWMVVAGLIYLATLGVDHPAGLGDFARRLFTTPRGWALIVLGNLAGLGFAVVTLTVSMASFPMVVDKPAVDPVTAVETSVRAVRENSGVMASWGLRVAGLLALGALPAFIGLAVVLPVLGYATWHLYTRLVER
jgi:uncharacterized membrane protein